MKVPPIFPDQVQEKNIINPDLWQFCAGPLVNLPAVGTLVVYFPQGHIEQVTASMKKSANTQIPIYPNLDSAMLCILHNVTLHADPKTDEVYAQMTLQPVPEFDKEALLRSDLSMRLRQPQREFVCKTLTASDTSTNGGLSVPRRAAKKIFPPLDYSLQPPAQELEARDLQDHEWTFRHIFRGNPRRHLLTTGWSLFVNVKKLSVGDSVIFIRDENQQHLLGIRRATSQPANLSSSVLTSDNMHIGVLAAAAYAVDNNTSFTVFYSPRTSPSEFVIPLAKYYNALCSNQLSPGMRFRMTFESEDLGTRRCMGTITGINDLDSLRWKNSQWRNIQVVWDMSYDGQRRKNVSIWEIEPVTFPFFMPPNPFYGLKRPRQPGIGDNASANLSLVQWMNIQKNLLQLNNLNTLPRPVMQNYDGPPIHAHESFQFISQRSTTQLDHLHKLPLPATMMQPQQQMSGLSPLTIHQNVIKQSLPQNRVQSQVLPHNVLQQQFSVQNHQQEFSQSQHRQNGFLQRQFPNRQQFSQPLQVPENQAQLLWKLHQQQQSLLAHQSALLQDQQIPLANVSRIMSTNQMMERPNITSQTNICASHNYKKLKLHHHTPAAQFSISCSTSPSAIMLPSLVDRRPYKSTSTSHEEITHTSGLENDVKPSLNIIDSQRKGFITPQTVCQPREPGTHSSSGTNKENHLGRIPHHLPITKRMMGSHNNFQNNDGMTLNFIDSPMNGSSLLNTGVLAPPPQPFQRLRSYIKVYKNGTVGRSIDIAAYSGFKELKNDLARLFGIKGPHDDLELVYVDHENDVLLVGDEPWEEFVSCVSFIKILSPQEVQQMNLDEYFGN